MEIIHWKSKLTEATGHGTVPLPDEHAKEVVKKLNEEHPELHHWTEEFKEKSYPIVLTGKRKELHVKYLNEIVSNVKQKPTGWKEKNDEICKWIEDLFEARKLEIELNDEITKINSPEETLHESIPNSWKFRIKFESANKRKEFFDALNKIKKVTYDWGHDTLMCNDISISGDEFIEVADIYALTSADIVFVLKWNYIEVSIIVDYSSKYATFKNEKELKDFLDEIDEAVRMKRRI